MAAVMRGSFYTMGKPVSRERGEESRKTATSYVWKRSGNFRAYRNGVLFWWFPCERWRLAGPGCHVDEGNCRPAADSLWVGLTWDASAAPAMKTTLVRAAERPHHEVG